MSANISDLITSLDVRTIFIILLGFVLVRWLLQKPKNLPPGPTPWPIIGNMFSLGTLQTMPLNIRKMKETYKSDIVYLKFGIHHAVVLLSYEMAHEAFSRSDISYRHPEFPSLNMAFGYGGVATSNGKTWSKNRRYMLSKLRDMGMGKSRIEQIIEMEANHLCFELEQKSQGFTRSVDLKQFFGPVAANIVCNLNFGKRFDYDDLVFEDIIKSVHDLVGSAQNAAITAFPFLRFLPFDLFKYEKLAKNVENIRVCIKKEIRKHHLEFQENVKDDFIDLWLDDCAKNDQISKSITESTIEDLILDMLVAGIETSTTTLYWAFLAVMMHPEVQTNIQEELDKVVPRSRTPNMSDKSKLPYTVAVLSESQRFFNSLPFGAPHSNQESIELAGYDIPAGSIIMLCTDELNRDARYWPNPDEFDPVGNFLDRNGRLLNREQFIPFGIGKRICAGESIARTEMFLTFSTLLQRFIFKTNPNEGKPVDDSIKGLTLVPKPYKVMIEPRFNFSN